VSASSLACSWSTWATIATSYFAPLELAVRLHRWVAEYNQHRQQSGHRLLLAQMHPLGRGLAEKPRTFGLAKNSTNTTQLSVDPV
jgi:hypothetical protein